MRQIRSSIVEQGYVKKCRWERESKMLKREDVRQKLVGWGIENPTDEQISDYLATISKETKSAEDRANKFKADSDRVRDLEKQIEELNSANLTDIEKANKATEDAMNKVADLEKTVKKMEQLKALADIGIVGEDADGLVGEDGVLNIEKLGQIIGAKEKAAVDVYKKQALDSTPAPDDKGNPDDGDDKGNPLTKDMVDRVAASKKAETEAVNIIDSYK